MSIKTPAINIQNRDHRYLNNRNHRGLKEETLIPMKEKCNKYLKKVSIWVEV